MSTIDWRDPARLDVLHCVMVDPNNLDEIYGDLEDVQLGSTSLTWGWNTDTVCSCGLSFLKGANYVPNAWIRIIHEVPAAGYALELGTFIPTAPAETLKGARVVRLDLQSPLWGLKEDRLTERFSVGRGGSLLAAMGRVLDRCGRPYVTGGAFDVTAPEAVVYDVGTSCLQILQDLAAMTGNRLDLDGHGRVLIAPVPDHRTLTPAWTLDADDERSVIIEGSISMESNLDELPSRVIAVNGNYVGVADLGAASPCSAQLRGYTRAVSFSDKTIRSRSTAQSMARQYLDEASMTRTWKMQTLYFPARCGENVTFILDGEKHVCMIQSVDPLNLATMTMTLTIREVNYNG